MAIAESREQILEVNLNEEASVLEICNELVQGLPAVEEGALKAWLKQELTDAAEQGRIGFYLDEFGAQDVHELEVDEGLAMLEDEDTWSAESDRMLHVFRLED